MKTSENRMAFCWLCQEGRAAAARRTTERGGARARPRRKALGKIVALKNDRRRNPNFLMPVFSFFTASAFGVSRGNVRVRKIREWKRDLWMQAGWRSKPIRHRGTDDKPRVAIRPRVAPFQDRGRSMK